MQELIIQAASRTETGSSPCRRMRHKGLVPGVVYGHGQLRNVSLNFRDFNHLLHSMHAEHAVVKCTIDTDDVHVLIKAVQRNGVTHNIAHVDLMIVDLDEIVIVAVPVETFGEADGVRNHGGVLELLRREIEVECKARDIPENITIDVTNLAIHHVMCVRDLPAIPGVTYKFTPETPVATVAAPTLHVEATPEEAAAATAEPEVITARKLEEGEEGAASADAAKAGKGGKTDKAAAKPEKTDKAAAKPAAKAEKKEKK